jgi:hypothetical protein
VISAAPQQIVEDLVSNGEITTCRVGHGDLGEVVVMRGSPRARAVTLSATEDELWHLEPLYAIEVPVQSRTVLDLLPRDPIGGRRREYMGSERRLERIEPARKCKDPNRRS